tara:strand:+ start:61 stop:279 length:219 start_codon:yes stop_codon:yes gene_type:complete
VVVVAEAVEVEADEAAVAAEADVEVVEAVEELEEALDLLGVIELGQQETKLKELVELQLEKGHRREDLEVVA